MNNILRSIRFAVTGKRGVSFFFCLASFACMVIMLILYRVTGITTFTPVLSGKVLALMYSCIVVSAVLCVFEVKLLKYALYILCFATWLEYLISEAFYITNVLVAIDGNSFTPAFILTVVFGLVGWACALTSAILQKNELPEAISAKEADV